MTDTAVPLSPPEKPARPSAKKKAASMLLAALAGGVFGGVVMGGLLAVAPDFGDATLDAIRADLGRAGLFILIPLALLGALVAIAVHEAGHVAGGLAGGMRFWLYVAGPLRVQREDADGPIAVSFNREAALWGGVAGCIPRSTERLARRMAVMVAGGPLASGVLAALAAPLAWNVAMPPLLTFFVGVTACASGAVMVATLIPNRAGGFMSDGARLIRFLRGGAPARRDAATVALMAKSDSGERPADFPRELVLENVGPADGTLDESFGRFMAYVYHLDRGEMPDAERELARAVELMDRWPAPFTPGLEVEAAYFAAAVRGDAAAARDHLSRVPERSPAVKPYDRERALAAAALAEGNLADAAAHARRGLDTVPRRDAFRRDLLQQTLRAAEAPAADSVPA